MQNIKQRLRHKIRIRNQQDFWRNNFFKYYDKNQLTEKMPREDQYITKWTMGGVQTDPIYYRAFYQSHPDKDLLSFVPQDILFIVIFPLLNRLDNFRALSDKNMYDRIYPKKLFPEAYLRKINGGLYNDAYEPVHPDKNFFEELAEKTDKLIFKPATHSCGGNNVTLFKKEGNSFYNGSKKLTAHYLVDEVKGNWILQEYIEQNNFAEALNRSSLNSVRVITYRSVQTERVRILRSYVRIGTPGSITDNLSGTGFAAELNSNGRLSGTAHSLGGQKITEAGGITLSEAGFYPNFEKVKETAITIAEQIPHQRLLGFDLVVDNKNNVRLIELNTKNIAPVQTTGASYFGEFTDEVYEYCKRLSAGR